VSGLLRSVIDYDGSVTQENLAQNYLKLQRGQVEWTRGDDKKIFQFVQAYFQNHLELPQSQTLLDYFGRQKDDETVERVKDIGALPAYIRTNFTHLLRATVEEQNRAKVITLFKEGQEIASKGLMIEGEKKQGTREAISHFFQNANALIQPDNGAKLRGDIRQDGQAMWNEYVTAEANKHLAHGRYSGLAAIDTVCKGIKKGELWVHAAFTGELKSTFAINWCYNLVTKYGENVFYASLEVPYEQIRRIAYVIHSTHPKWARMGYSPLPYGKVRDGELNDEEKAFYKLVIEDFCNNPAYGRFEVWRPEDDVTTDDIKIEAELFHKQHEIGLLVIDHGGLVEPRKKKRNKDYVVELNSVIRDSKKLALNFNRADGVPVLLLFQINRQGKDEADKAEGRYKIKALAYANEAERSADVISTTYLNDEHRRSGTTLFCNLKNRDNPLFEPFTARVNFQSRRITNLDNLAAGSTPGMAVEDHRSLMHGVTTALQQGGIALPGV
jgi:replicative DNA helicase